MHHENGQPDGLLSVTDLVGVLQRMLVCPTCGGHFEARIAPWKGQREVYICSTRRRKPGVCTNTLALPITETDDDVLGIVEGEVLGTRFIEELLAQVDDGHQHEAAHLDADRERLAREISNLMDLAASGVPAETIAPKIRGRQSALAKVDAQLRIPRQAPPNMEKLRAALTQRAEQWKADLRAEPKVARLLRRLVGPLTLWEETEAGPRWEAETTPENLLDGLVQLGTSPAGQPLMYGLHQMASPKGNALMHGDDSIRVELAGHADERAA